MFRRRLLEDGAERAFLEKLDLFRQNPGLIEKYLIDSGASPEVRDSFLSRFFGSEGLSAVADAQDAIESIMDSERVEEKSGRVAEKSLARGDEHWRAVEELKQQVLNLTRQVAALQRQLQMQGEVSRLAASLEGRLDEIASACERRAAEAAKALRAEIRRLDVGSRVADVERGLGDLKKELGLRARAEDLKKTERWLHGRISVVEARVAGAEKMLLAERIDLKSDPLDGIIAHLTRECGGNVHKERVVNVTASSYSDDIYKPENAVDLKSDSLFFSKSWLNSWICYDFKGRRLTPTSYSIRSCHWGPGCAHPKSWVLEVSNDGSEGSWKEVDSRKDNNDLNDSHVIRNFSLGTPQSGAFRFVRLRQTGNNHCGRIRLAICALELFGTLSKCARQT